MYVLVKVIVNVRLVFIDFNNKNFDESIEEVESYEFHTEDLFDEKAELLFNSIMEIRGGWASYDLSMNERICIVDYDLIYTGIKLEESDRKTVSSVLNKIKEFIDNIKINTDVSDKIHFDPSDNCQEGIILKVIKPGEITTNYEELETFLSKKKVDYSIVSKISSHAEVGAGGGESEVLLFVANTVASGVTWDMLKLGISQIVSPYERISFKILENYRFKRIRSIVSNKSRIDKRELILNDFLVNEDKGLIQMVFKARRKYIYICCDTEYNILAYKLSNKKVIEDMITFN